MPEKKTAARKAAAAAETSPAAGPLTDDHAARPEAPERGTPGGPTSEEGPPAGPGATPRPAGTKSAAVRMMTRSVAGKKPAAARGEAQRVADAAKPSQMPQAGGGRRGPRRGASKGR
jgi:hypothetical protein